MSRSAPLIVVASANGIVSIEESMRVLMDGGPVVDAVETGIRIVEANPDDHTVGLGGFPNLLGRLEVDAGIVDGRDLSAGAVGALHSSMRRAGPLMQEECRGLFIRWLEESGRQEILDAEGI